MPLIVSAKIVCYAPDDYGVMYEYANGGIGGRRVGNIDDAIREVASINKGPRLRA